MKSYLVRFEDQPEAELARIQISRPARAAERFLEQQVPKPSQGIFHVRVSQVNSSWNAIYEVRVVRPIQFSARLMDDLTGDIRS
jgi:hypothetical protein